ncbi:hypothetical protein [Dolichospermum phage Dfl-JY45]
MGKRSLWYILRDRIAFPCEDLEEVARQQLDPAAWRVAHTVVAEGACWVSTVFLGLDHSAGQGDPLLFETMAFLQADASEGSVGEPRALRRYSSWVEAEAGHAEMVKQIEAEYLAAADHVRAGVARAAGAGGVSPG